MKRRVIPQGNSTLTITLPRNWTKEMGINAGDELEVQVSGSSLLINTQQKKIKKTISINVDGLERLALAKFLNVCFEQGYDTITLTYSKSKISSW